MLKDEGFATAQKVKLSFLGVGVMDDEQSVVQLKL